MYNVTGVAGNSTSFIRFVQGVNSLTDNWFGILLYMGLMFILFINFYFGSGGDTRKAVMASAMIGMLFVILMKAMSLVPTSFLTVTLVGCAIAIAFTWNR